ncbi:MAG: 4-phospho-D-threonate 3-dehydrogenase / 4-phospho-D-erythronate 3-dehydrogenase [Candidatus Petromonas sp.]|nr:4-phospho-D-threonate 3-dehydrogenase / 4-phospho-D-erythronate 3-dehydrogenase [Candidatus Petromonas sp.]
MNKHMPIIGVTMGDPSGIGPEIILKSYLDDNIKSNRLIVIGDFGVMSAMAEKLRISTIKLNKVNSVSECKFDEQILNVYDLNNVDILKLKPGKVQAMSGNAAFEYVKKATELAMKKKIDAIATAPLNKEAMHKAGHVYPGHTEILAKFTEAKDYAMFLYDEALRVIHVSTHISLLDAIKGLRKERVAAVIDLAHNTMIKLGYENPRIAVAGINPHAGEGGLFGDEEIKEIIPAIKLKRSEGINVEGPEPPDTVFLRAKEGSFDVVVAMYHDQGHIPLKLLGFHSGVNITVGLPIIRTSVDHGTAFGKAWKGIANESSMKEAIKLAIKLA